MPPRSARIRLAAVLAVAAAGGTAALLSGGADDGGRSNGTPAGIRRPQLVASVSLASSLGAVEPAFGSVWIDDTARGQLLRVDPARARVLARVALNGRAILAAGRGGVWVLQRGVERVRARLPLPLWGASTGPLLHVDPRTAEVRARIAIRAPGSSAPEPAVGVLAASSGVWLLGPRRLLRVGGARIDRVVDLSTRHAAATGATVHRGELVVGTADGVLLRHDARTGRHLGTATTGVPITAVRPGGDGVLLVATGVLAAADPVTGRVRWRRSLGNRVAGTLRDARTVWAEVTPPLRLRDLLVGLDPATGRTVAQTELGRLGAVDVGDVGRRLWVTMTDGRVDVFAP